MSFVIASPHCGPGVRLIDPAGPSWLLGLWLPLVFRKRRSVLCSRPVTRRRATVPVMAGVRSGLDQAALMHAVAVFGCAPNAACGLCWALHEGLGFASFPVVRLTIIIPRSNS